MISYKLFIVITTFICFVHNAKILGVFPMAAKSLGILGSNLLKGFAERGHEVTMLSPFPLKNPPKNYRDIVIGMVELRKVYESNLMSSYGFNNKAVQIYSGFTKMSEVIFQDSNVQALIKSEEHFDVIIYLQCGIDSLWGLSHKFNASTIMFNALGAFQLTSYSQGNPLPSSYVPNFASEFSGVSELMTFWERACNLFTNALGHLYLHFWNDPVQRKLLKEHFPEAPSLDVLNKNTDLVFLNSHAAITSSRPIFQNMINIGGFYIKSKSSSSSLPEDIESFLEKSQHGVILFSFGSNVKSANVGNELINHCLEYFRQSPYDILWNFDIDLPNKSSNVKILNWLPQIAVLGHRNVKLFITHGGLGSVSEAIYHGVPMIIIPFYMDQHSTSKYCAQMEIAIQLKLKDVTSEKLKNAVKEIESNPKYRKNMQQHTNSFKNQEVDPMAKAIYWTEFVINNRGAKFLKSPTLSMPWYQLVLLDVMAFAMFIFIIFMTLVYYISKLLLGYFRSSFTDKQDNKEKRS